jgi:hypothetical protein
MLKLKMGALPTALARMAGLSTGKLHGANRWRDEVLERAIANTAGQMKARILRRWQADGQSRAQVRYIGLVLQGID